MLNILTTAFEFPIASDEPIVSGEIKNTYNFAMELSRKGHNVTVLNVTNAECPAKYMIGDVAVYRVGDIKLRGVVRYLYRAYKVREMANRLVREGNDYDVIHNHISYGSLGIIMSKLKDKTLVTTPHGTNIPEIMTELSGSLKDRLRRINAELQKLLDIVAYTKSKVIISGSAFQLKEMKEIYKVNSDVMKVIYNGANSLSYYPKDSIMKNKKCTDLLFIGRACKKKGLDTIRILAERNTSWNFTLIVGTPAFNTIGYELINEIRKMSNCRVYESVPEPDIPEFYRKADVTVVPSRGYESLPTVVHESLSCGTPVVSVKAWGIPETIKDASLMFQEDNVADIERAIQYALSSDYDFAKAYDVKKLSESIDQLIDCYY